MARGLVTSVKADGVEQQALFEAKVAELSAAATKISMLEDSVARHLTRHQGLEDELQV